MKDIAKAEFVHAVPPCGAVCAARNQTSLARFKTLGIKEPQPLRTKEFPKGKPHLIATDRIEVKKANQIYEFIAKVMSYCCLWGSCVQWKTPRILFWDFPAVAGVMNKWNMIEISFQACMSGSIRNRSTSLGKNSHLFWEMDIKCDQSHPHDPSGLVMHNDRLAFATKLECEYPEKMCDSIAKIVATYMKILPDLKPMRAKAKSCPIAQN